MRSIFVIFLAVVFSFSTMANPFSDVPMSHWAYDAVAKLSNSGLITGFPDGSFKGNRTMTRYELAMVVARVMAKTGTVNVKNADMAIVERLTVEFADELALLGVKVTALEDEVAVVKDDVAMLKDKVAEGKTGNIGKINFSGSITMRGEMNTYEKSANSAIRTPAQAGVANPNTFNGVNAARTAAQTNENATNFYTEVDIFLDAQIEENISFHSYIVNLISGSYDIWGTAAHSADDVFATDAVEAYVKVEDFFGWADSIKFGRQYYGVANGIMFSGRDSYESQGCSWSDFGYDGITAFKRFTDVTSMDIYALRTDTDANTGLNVMGLTMNFELERNLNLKVYYAARNDNQIFDPADGNDYNDITGFGAWLNTQYANNANYAVNHDNPTKIQYYGLAVNGDLRRDLVYYAEITVLDFLDTVLDPDDYVNWTDSINNQKAYMIGLQWNAHHDLDFTMEFRSFDEYYRPINARLGLYGSGYDDPDCMSDTEYDNLGYTSDFRDFFVKLNWQASEKTNVVLTYESIDDTTSIPGLNRKDDDMNVWTLGFQYQYKPNTQFRLYWKQFDVEEFDNGTTGTSLPNFFSDANNNGVYDTGVDSLNLHDAAQEDHSQVRAEMIVNF